MATTIARHSVSSSANRSISPRWQDECRRLKVNAPGVRVAARCRPKVQVKQTHGEAGDDAIQTRPLPVTSNCSSVGPRRLTRCRVSHQWRRARPPSQLQPQITSRHYSISNAPPISLAVPGIPRRTAMAGPRRVGPSIHHHDQDCRSSPAAPSSYRPTPWPSTHGQNWNCFLDVAAALRVLGAPAAYCRTTILLQVAVSEPSPDADAHRPLKPLSASSPSSTKMHQARGLAADGSRMDLESFRESQVSSPHVSRYCSPQSPVAHRGDLFALHLLRTW